MSRKFYRYFHIIFIYFLAMTGCAKKQDVVLKSQDGQERQSQLSETAEAQASIKGDSRFTVCARNKHFMPGPLNLHS
jgi:hypothetical protein